jgi:hypothetical protein
MSNCTAAVTSFVLTPLGRLAYTGPGGSALAASAYPGGSNNSVLLRADGNDTTLFGPLVIPPELAS